ncbi:unnamed protein product [Aphanomyces euteiches]
MVSYCNRACQTQHWKQHKTQCHVVPHAKSVEDVRHDFETQGDPSTEMVALANVLLKVLLVANPTSGPATIAKEYIAHTPPLVNEWMQRLAARPAFYSKVPLQACTNLVKAVHELTQAMAMTEMEMVHPQGDLLNHEWIVKRVNSVSIAALMWFSHAPLGDVRQVEEHIYSPTLHHSYTNALPPLVSFDRVHVAVGYVDLSMLFTATNLTAPLRWIGYEASVYSVAKTLVLRRMLLDEAAVDCILQVWYSSAWSERTLRQFRAAVVSVLSHDWPPSVAQLLAWWHQHTPTLAQARREWLGKTDHASLDPLANAASPQSRAHLFDYLFTGQLLEATVGSVTMCCLPPGFESSCGRDESVFQTIPWSDLVDAIEDGDLVAAATTTLRHKLRGLQENMMRGKIVVDIRPPCLVSQDSARDVARWNASTISWSNVMDYMRVETFHALARRCGTPSTVHSGYSMNWVTLTKGTMFLDHGAGEHQAKLLEEARQTIQHEYRECGADRFFCSPPLVNPVNLVNYALCAKYVDRWTATFASGNLKFIHHELLSFSVLARGNSTLHLSWHYD